MEDTVERARKKESYKNDSDSLPPLVNGFWEWLVNFYPILRVSFLPLLALLGLLLSSQLGFSKI